MAKEARKGKAVTKSSAKASPEREALVASAEAWREAKARERAARDALAVLVREGVATAAFTETKAAKWTGIPRMTIRKMLGKD